MPRKKRKKGDTRSGRKRVLDERKARFWKARVRAGIKEKEEFTAAASEVDDYFKSKHDSLFSDTALAEHFMRFAGSSAVSVPKAAQIRNSMAPHLYTLNPKRNVNPKSDDGVMLGLARVLEAYINRTPREGKLARESRRVIDDSLLRGRGFGFTGWDDTLGIVTTWSVSSRDVVVDPDVKSYQDAEWIAIRRIVPLFRLKREVTDKWRKRNLKANYRTIGEDADVDDDGTYTEQGRRAPLTNDLVEVWDVYSKMGAGQHGLDFEGSYSDSKDDFVKITISMDHAVPLFEGEWEVPLYLDSDWPLEPLDFVETLDSLWPQSVMSQVMPLQKAMDLLTTIELHACKNHGKTIVLGDSELPRKQQMQIRHGSPSEYIPVKLKPGEKLTDKFHSLDLGTLTPEIANARRFHERQFEATTGLTSTVTGAEEVESKDRSATASRLRGEATNARLGDMRARVEEWSTNVARHEALMVRLELDPDEVKPFVPPEAIGLFRVSIVPSEEFQSIFGVTEIPLRGKGDMTLEAMSPMSATYFASQEEASNALLQFLVDMAASAEFDYSAHALAQDLAESMGEAVFSVDALVVLDEMGQPQLNLPEGATVRPVVVADVWKDTAGISPKMLCRELAYEIATGSMQKFDKEREIDSANTAVQQVMPAAVQAQDYNMVNAILQRLDDALEIPEDKRLPPMQPPPPPPPEAAPPGGGEE